MHVKVTTTGLVSGEKKSVWLPLDRIILTTESRGKKSFTLVTVIPFENVSYMVKETPEEILGQCKTTKKKTTKKKK